MVTVTSSSCDTGTCVLQVRERSNAIFDKLGDGFHLTFPSLSQVSTGPASCAIAAPAGDNHPAIGTDLATQAHRLRTAGIRLGGETTTSFTIHDWGLINANSL